MSSTIGMKMPRYKSHKVIEALKIAAIEQTSASQVAAVEGGTWDLVPEDTRYGRLTVPHSYILKHAPHVGGYFVAYADGYQSFSPAKAFEEGYTPTDNDAPVASVEQSIQAAGADRALRVTPADIEAGIASEHYFTAADGAYGSTRDMVIGTTDERYGEMSQQALGLLTFCVLVLRNGHRIVGVNEGPVSAENFDSQLGRKLARQKAIDQIWPLMGFRLRDRLHQTTQAVAGSNIGSAELTSTSETSKFPEGTVAVLNLGASVITVDDHCYVLKNLCDGHWRASNHIFPEALKAMNELPHLS